MKKFLSIILACSMILSLAGCSGSNAATSGSAADGESLTSSSASDGADSSTGSGAAVENGLKGDSLSEPATAPDTSAPAAATMSGEDGFDYADDYAAEGDFVYEGVEEGAIADSAAGGSMAGGMGDGEVMDGALAADDYFEMKPEEPAMTDPAEPEIPPVTPAAGLLTGGEWNDNENWNDWVSLYQSHDDWNHYRDYWEIDYDIRHEVIVIANGEPVEGAAVTNPDGEGVNSAVTDNNGRAYLFLEENLDSMEFNIDVNYGEVTVSAENVNMQSDGSYTVDLTEALAEAEAEQVEALDLMLMIDTTGSMSDELWYLQEELNDVITRVKQENANIPIRVSVNFYRDEQDEYVIREFEFTDDIGLALTSLAEQDANGGGDYPEAVHTALDSAVNNHDWDENSTKLMFFVLDAPPHDDEQIIDAVNQHVEAAAEQGIRIIPVASSGIDKSTEYLLRTMAFRTGGTYTFLTDHSGIGGGHIEPTIGEYEVEKLNDMMVRVIGEYLK